MANAPAPRTRKKKRHKRRSNFFGNFFFLIVGLAAGGSGIYIYQNGYDKSLEDWKGLFAKEEVEQPKRSHTGGTEVIATKMDLRPKHELDERWEPAILLGEEGKALFEQAVNDHYGDDPDPFKFRARMADAKKMMEQALEDLHTLRKEYGDNPNSANEIDKKIRRYNGSLAEYGPKARNR
ncbi:MAG: hypothetical protein ACPG31_05035 [Planctomycetota bacterium]